MTRPLALALVFLAPLAVSAQAPSHVDAVRQLLVVSGSEAAYAQGLALATDAMLDSNPMGATLRPVIEEFYETYARWEDVEDGFVEIYLDLLTEPEVHELIAWYQTDLGQRMLEVQPEIQRRCVLVGQRVVQEHQAELEAMILEALGNGPPPPPAPPRKKGL